MLCDFAEAMNGKLYIMGGGWSDWHGDLPVTCAVGLRIAVPWNQANQSHNLTLQLVTEDGQVVTAPDGNEVTLNADFEVGRPPGTLPGRELVNAVAFKYNGLPLAGGGYRFELLIDGTEMSRASFYVHRTEAWESDE